MIRVHDTMHETTARGSVRVEGWIAAHRDLWDQWSQLWEEVSAYPLQVAQQGEVFGGQTVAVRAGEETFGWLGSEGRAPQFEPWLQSIALLIGDALATEYELDTMTDELVDSYDQLTFLYEIARMLSTTSTLSDALTKLLGQARHIVGADGSALVIERAAMPLLILTDGAVPPVAVLTAAHHAVTQAERPLVANNRETVATTVAGAGESSVESIVVAPIVTSQGTASAACFGATKPGGFTAGNRKLMQAVVEQSIAIVGQFAFQEEQIRQSRLARDLELAAQIQTALLPGPFPGTPLVSLVAAMIPASEVGGDFYTHPDERAEPDDVLALAIGDVAGKGVAAALIATVCLSAMRAEMRHVTSPAHALRAVQGFIADELSRIDSFVTCILAIYDPRTRHLTYANAGHTAILHWRATERRLTSLPATGLPLGVDIGVEVENAAVTLAVGDMLLFSTDGVIEAAAANGEFFGDARLRMLMEAHADQPPEEVRDIILGAVRSFAPSQRDDITVVILKAEA